MKIANDIPEQSTMASGLLEMGIDAVSINEA